MVTLSLSQVGFLYALSLLCGNILEATAAKTHQTRDKWSVLWVFDRAGFAKHTKYPLTGLSSGIHGVEFGF